MEQLAGIYARQHRYVEAEETYLRLISARRNSLGVQHPETRNAMASLRALYATDYRFQKAQGNVAEARRAATKSLPFLKESRELESARGAGADRTTWVWISMSLSTANALVGNYAEAERIYSEIVTNQIEIGAPTELIAGPRSTVAWLQSLQGNYEIAEATFRETCEFVRDVERTLCLNLFGATLAAQKKFSEAESLLLKAYEERSLVRGRLANGFVAADYSAEAQPGERILKLYEDWGKPEKVAEWRDRLGSDKTRLAQGVRYQATGMPNSPWTFDLDMGTTSLTGFVAMNTGMAPRREIYDGKVEGNTISFKVTSPDGFRTISFIGELNGNEIAFTRSVQFRNGGNADNTPGGSNVFGVGGAMRFPARRAN